MTSKKNQKIYVQRYYRKNREKINARKVLRRKTLLDYGHIHEAICLKKECAENLKNNLPTTNDDFTDGEKKIILPLDK